MSLSQIRHRMSRELRKGGGRPQNLLAVVVMGAIMFMGYVHIHGDVQSLGADFVRGHGMLTGSVDLPMSAYNYAVTTGGLNSAYMEGLCASTGAVNIGVYRGHLYIMYKWMVSAIHRAAGAHSKRDKIN